MKKQRILSFILAVTMILPMAVVGTSAKTVTVEKNSIEIAEEIFVENGDFEEGELSLSDKNLRYGWTAMEDGYWYWSTNDKTENNVVVKTYEANVTVEQDGDNHYMLVESETSVCMSYAPVADLPKGEYTLSLQVYPEVGISSLTFDVRKITGNSHTSLFNGYVQKNLTANTWNTITIPVVVTDDSADLIFRFYGGTDYSTVKYRIDNVSLGRPGDVLIETADMESVSSTAVSSVTQSAPVDGVWAASDATYLTLDNSNSYVAVKKNPSFNKIGDTPAIAYTLKDALDKGKYRISFDVAPAGSGTWTFQVADVSSTWNNDGIIANKTQSVSGETRKFTAVFDITKDNTPVAFRFYAGTPPMNAISVDNFKLEVYNSEIVFYDETFDTEGDVIKGSIAWSHTTGSVWVKDACDYFGYKRLDDGNGVVAMECSSGTPSIGFTFGALPKGEYTFSFSAFKKDNVTGGFLYDVRSITGKADGQYGDNVIGGYQSGPSLKYNEWTDYSFNFTVNEHGQSYLFRFWSNNSNNPTDIYFDNVKLVGKNCYPMTTIEEDDFSQTPPITASNMGFGWANMVGGYWNWSANGAEHIVNITPIRFDNKSCLYLSNSTQTTPSFSHSPAVNLAAGHYELKLKMYVAGSNSLNVRFNLMDFSASNIFYPKDTTITVQRGSWQTICIPFDITSASARFGFRFYSTNATDNFYITDYSIEGTALKEWDEVYSNDFSTAPNYQTGTKYYSLFNAAQYADTWFLRDEGIRGTVISHDAVNEKLLFSPSDYLIYQLPYVYYGFKNTFTKGSYSINISSVTPAFDTKYEIAAIDRSGNVLSKSDFIAKADENSNASLGFTVNGDTDVLLRIKDSNGIKFTTCYNINSVEVYKLSNPVIGINANGDIAQFDAQTGTYYMITGIEGANGYINYSKDTKLEEGIYRLSGYFKTTDASGVQIGASVGYLHLDEIYEIGAEWTKVTYTVTLPRDTELSLSEGVRFTLEGNSTFYFKDLELVYIDDLPSPVINSGIAMVLLKKMQGLMKPKVEKKLYNFVPNFDFDEAPTIREGNLAYGWAAQKNGEWAMSLNSADKEGTGSLTWTEYKNEKALYIEGNKTNPCISFKLPETLEAGLYTLSIDTFVEGAGQKGFMLDVFDMQSGAAVRIGEGAAIMSRSVKAGEWSTMSVTFSAPANASVLFRFWSANASINYYVDNIKITKPGVFSDGSVEEVVNDTKGLVKNGDFAEAPAIGAKALNYGWAGAKDGEWNYSVNANEQADAKCTLSYGEVNGEKCLKVDTNTNPSVSYALNGKVKPGAYTLSMDIYAVGNGSKTFNFDVFDMTTGSIVRATAGAAMVNAKVEAGKWVTVNVPFTVLSDADIVFRTFPAEKLSFYIDNVTIK